MKKILFPLLLILSLTLESKAQDTVRYGDPWYQFHPLPNLTPNLCEQDYYFWTSDILTKSFLGYANENNSIYGIAVVMDSLPGPEWNFVVTLLRGMKYEQVSGGTERNILIDSLYAMDTIRLEECSLTKQCRFEYLFGDNTSAVRNCYELYFDTPFFKIGESNDFADTFFVGVSYSVPSSVLWTDYAPFLPNVCFGADDSVITTTLTLLWANNRIVGFYQAPNIYDPRTSHTSQHTLSYVNRWGGIFPIIERRCSAPRGLTLSADSSLVHWRSDTDAELFQLSICNHMWTDPDVGTLFTTTATSQALPSFLPDSNYYIYLRKACSFREDTVWSDWSEPLVVSSRQPDVGIDGVSTPDFQFSISPNPTDGSVTVRHTATEGTLTVTDLQGREIQTIKQLHNQTITLDLGPLPQGTYIVTLSTPSGTASQTVIKN